MVQHLLWIYWDPNPTLFTIPYFELPVRWYGVLFAFGFLLSYLVVRSLLKETLLEAGKSQFEAKNISQTLIDRLIWFVFFGTLLGARLGHVLFYQWGYYSTHPWEILQIWHGGLASHGAVVGVSIALYFFYQVSKTDLSNTTFLGFFDLFCISVPLTGACIRLGNFFNQEIVGTPSTLPWAVLFGHPFDGNMSVPRHPVQLYEALSYLLIFGILCFLWKKKKNLVNPGFYSGLMFILIFSARFLLEYMKTPQSHNFQDATLLLGQWLSLPCIAVGIALMSYSFNSKKKSRVY